MAQSEVSLRSRVGSRVRTRKNQLGYGLAVLALVVILGIYLGSLKISLAAKWVIGIAFGIILQRSRFCFTASMRDPVLTGSTSLARAVLIAIAVATVGFAGFQFSAYMNGKPIPGLISPVGLHTVVGAILFGIGMVIAGGCASGTLMRVGEGFVMLMVTLVFFVVGSVLGAIHLGWWQGFSVKSSPAVFLPNVLGWPLAFFGQFALLGALYWLATWWEYRKVE
ncbi:MAG TPA: transporter [Peptococcaceae bacterium]|nr:transporter [Peptococcaceae bacterium]